MVVDCCDLVCPFFSNWQTDEKGVYGNEKRESVKKARRKRQARTDGVFQLTL